MSSPTTDGDARKAPAGSTGQAISCPKCHAPLLASSSRRRARWLAPLWLRLLVLVLILAGLAAPVAAIYHRRSRILDEARMAARDYLDRLRGKDANDARKMMTDSANQQVAWLSLRSILKTDGVKCEITDATRNGELVDVAVTCVVPDDVKLPALPLEVDKNPRARLVLERQKDGQWQVSSVSLIPKAGTNAIPNFVPNQPAKAGMGGAPPPAGEKKQIP